MVKVESQGNRQHIEQALKDLESKALKVGWFETAQYEDGTPVAYVATIQEFGYPAGGIEARPFVRPTVREKENEWQQMLAKGAKQVVEGNLTVAQMLDAFGASAVGDIQEAITAVTEPALKDSTIRARKSRRRSAGVSTKPLIDTGLMLQSVSRKVEDV